MRGPMNLFLNRLFRAAKLDAGLYEEVIADPKTMFQAMMAVFIYSAASAYGGFGRAGVAGINFAMITTIVGWYIWTFSTYFVGVRLLPEAGTIGDRKAVLRAMGFASSPGLIRMLGLIPGFTGVTLLIASVWMFVAAVVAIGHKTGNELSKHLSCCGRLYDWLDHRRNFSGLDVRLIAVGFRYFRPTILI
jgi:hypothetical protein